MRRRFFAAVLVLVGVVALAGAASANPWPDWNAVTGTFPVDITKTAVGTGYDYAITVDPHGDDPGWAIKAFVVYVTNVTTQEANGWKGYDIGTSTWTDTNGGWEQDKYTTDPSAAFGWQTGGPAGYLFSGDSGIFHARNLPAGYLEWGKPHYAVHVVPPNGAQTFWSEAVPPSGGRTPEPGSLLLLSTGLATAVGFIRRRRSAAAE